MDEFVPSTPPWKRVLSIAVEVLLIAVIIGLIVLILLPVFMGTSGHSHEP